MNKYIKLILFFLSIIGLIVALQYINQRFVDEKSESTTVTGVSEMKTVGNEPAQAPEVNQVDLQLARKIREYKSACKDATLEFTKISELGKFLEKNPDCDTTLKAYYQIYKDAYDALRVLVPQNGDSYEGTLGDFREICIPINVRANMSTELTTFRDCFQVIFLKDGKGQNIVFNELAWNPRSLDFSKYTSFFSLKLLKEDLERFKYE